MFRKHLIVLSLGAITLAAVAIAQGQVSQSTHTPDGYIRATIESGEPIGTYYQFTPDKELSEDEKRIFKRDRDLTRDTRTLLATYAKTTGSAKKQEVAESLKQTVAEHFGIKQQIRETQLVELETRVKRLRELHDNRESAKATIIEKRFQLLIDEANGLGWSSSPERKALYLDVQSMSRRR